MASVSRHSTPYFQLGRLASRQVAPPHTLQALAREFVRSHAVHLPAFLDAALLQELQRRLATASWSEQIHPELTPPARNLRLSDPALYTVMLALMNDPKLTRFVERVTGCDPVGTWIGQLYWMDSVGGHRDAWHDDVDGNRMVAISVNLSRAPFAGGELSMRHADSREVLWTFANTGPGDAIMFRLRADLEHYIAEVTGPEPKLAIAGWFQRTPKFWEKP